MQFGRYQVVRELGRFGQVTVYLAHDDQLGREVAVKVPTEGAATESEFGLANEARTLAALPHHAIESIFDFGSEGGRPYCVLEYLRGSLREEIGSGLPSHERTATICFEMAQTLDYVHRRGFLHRNIKPSVILVDSGGAPKLSGFGLAVKHQEFIPDPNRIAGTIPYMSPEQIQGGRLGPFTDIWLLGGTMYKALTGRRPFAAGDMKTLIHAILKTDPEPPSKLAPAIPAELERICLKCLAKDPAERYSTGQAMAADLRAWQVRAPETKAHRVFVSHSGADREFVESRMISLLERNGIKTWYSKVDIQTAAEWERSILHGLESCEWYLLVMSRQAADSPWVKDELFWAIDNRPDRIIAIRTDECEPREFHIRLARKQHVDMRGDLVNAERHLLEVFRADRPTGIE